jgi:hypothetical protein
LYLEKRLSQCHFSHHRFQMDCPRNEHGLPRWLAWAVTRHRVSDNDFVHVMQWVWECDIRTCAVRGTWRQVASGTAAGGSCAKHIWNCFTCETRLAWWLPCFPFSFFWPFLFFFRACKREEGFFRQRSEPSSRYRSDVLERGLCCFYISVPAAVVIATWTHKKWNIQQWQDTAVSLKRRRTSVNSCSVKPPSLEFRVIRLPWVNNT